MAVSKRLIMDLVEPPLDSLVTGSGHGRHGGAGGSDRDPAESRESSVSGTVSWDSTYLGTAEYIACRRCRRGANDREFGNERSIRDSNGGRGYRGGGRAVSDEPYYWRVRARNSDGVWSLWGPVWSFVSKGPGVPLDVALEMTEDDRTADVSWSVNPKGRRPATFRVYASDERGFSVSDQDHDVVVAKNRTERRRPNFWKEVEGTRCWVIGQEGEEANRAYYRVVAVDEVGNRSGPSGYATAPRPLLVGLTCEEGNTRQRFESRVLAVVSEGDLWTITIDENPYNPAFRDADQITYKLTEAPAWLTIDRDGVLTETPDETGSYQLKVEASVEGVGADSRIFDVRIREA